MLSWAVKKLIKIKILLIIKLLKVVVLITDLIFSLIHSVIIEIDEHQHKNGNSYTPECDKRRLNNLFTYLADRPIVFIRFNPDSYTNKKINYLNLVLNIQKKEDYRKQQKH